MLNFYTIENGKLVELPDPNGSSLPSGAMWIDILAPTPEEEARVQQMLGIDVPTRDEVSEIQTSSRLASSEGTLYMSALVPYGNEGEPVDTLPLTFIQHGDHLITVRYGHPEAVRHVVERSRLGLVQLTSPESILAALLEVVVDRVADRLEAIGRNLKRLEQNVFRRGTADTPSGRQVSLGRRIKRLQSAIERLGAMHQVVVELRECLASLTRLVAFRRAHATEKGARLKTIEQDLRVIIEHSSALTDNMEFVLDAVVGLIDVQQNKVIYILSIFSVVLTPPVLVASVYGMNFEYMPELKWLLGYPYALALMLLSAVIPFLAFKLKGWL